MPANTNGGGPEEEALRWDACALLFPAHEDFGIVPVEAQACGTPVVGLDRGGLLETVVHGETGYLIPGRSPRDYANAVNYLGELSPSRVTPNAERFSERMFAANLSQWIAAEAGLRCA